MVVWSHVRSGVSGACGRLPPTCSVELSSQALRGGMHRGGSGPPATSRPSHPITKDGRVFLVPTPGHFPGHIAVVARGEGVTHSFAGDATYAQQDLAADRVDGVTNDPALSLATLHAIKAFAAQERTVLLPAHDLDGLRRLTAGEVFSQGAPHQALPQNGGARLASATS